MITHLLRRRLAAALLLTASGAGPAVCSRAEAPPAAAPRTEQAAPAADMGPARAAEDEALRRQLESLGYIGE